MDGHRIAIVIPAVLAMFAATSAVLAAELETRRAPAVDRAAARSYVIAPLPIAPDSLSATVLASDGCWRACEARCGWQVRKCIKFNGVTGCLPLNDSCDRTCVKQCRAYGGALLNWTD
jgi:hypothetical protein